MLASPLIRIEGAATGYEPDRPVLRSIHLRIDQDDRIALLGQNGNGKSTFAKLIAGRLEATGGLLWRAPKLNVGYFAQHQLDDLNPTASPYDHIARSDAGCHRGAETRQARHLGL